MKYIWIWMLIVIDIVWLIWSIVDFVTAIWFVKESRRYGSVGDFINCVAEELKASTIIFVVLHLFILFIVSFITWANFKIGDVK